MREIKFRAWDSVANVWVENIDEMSVNRLNDHASYHHIMQFTGLLDKEGVEIYEGDIVYSGYEYDKLPEDFIKSNRLQVVFQDGCFILDNMGCLPMGSTWCAKFVMRF